MKRLWMVATLWLVCASAVAGSTSKFNEVLTSWIGADVEELLQEWPNPSGSQGNATKGEVSYYYQDAIYHAAKAPTYARTCSIALGCSAWSLSDPGHDAYYTYKTCQIVFDVEDGMVVKWRWAGDNCKQ